jgi:hypothetical protein
MKGGVLTLTCPAAQWPPNPILRTSSFSFRIARTLVFSQLPSANSNAFSKVPSSGDPARGMPARAAKATTRHLVASGGDTIWAGEAGMATEPPENGLP